MCSNALASRSRELRGGRLLTNCNCTRRNGLQYDCQRTECQGRAVCLTKPFPKCSPATFSSRFENVSMGIHTNSDGARRIRVLNNGSCVIQYNPAIGVHPENPRNPCGPKNPMCDQYWTQSPTNSLKT